MMWKVLVKLKGASAGAAVVAISLMLTVACGGHPPRSRYGVQPSAKAVRASSPAAILFQRGSQIYAYTPSTRHLAPITQASDGIAQTPAWSVDHRKMAYGLDADGWIHLMIAGADGAGARQVTFGRHDDADPTWSGDGTQIAFSRGRHIAVLDVSSGHVRVLGIGAWPAWDPVKDWIAFVSIGRNGGRVYRMRPDGTKVRALTRTVGAAAPIWSPDGREIVFGTTFGAGASPEAEYGYLATLDVTNGKLAALTHNHRKGITQNSPRFSSDRKSLVFERDSCKTYKCTPTSRLFMMSLATGALTTGPVGGAPSW
jgi:Tol biopolymer transport system component